MNGVQQESRKYFSLIERVGSWHKYQFIILILMFLIIVLQSSMSFVLPYLLHQQSYSCPQLNEQTCTKYVCDLKSSDQMAYLTNKSPFYSIADQLGNYRCEQNHQISTIQSLTFIGGTIGLAIFACFTQSIGRKTSLILSMWLALAGLLSIYFASNILMLAFGLFIGFSGIQNAYQLAYCYSSQVVSEEHRILFVTICSFANALGNMINSFTFYYFKDWKTVWLWFYLAPAVVIIFGAVYFIEKTPIDLLASQHKSQIVKTLNRIAVMNGVQNHQITEHQVELLQIEYQTESQANSFSAIDLFRFPSLRNLVIPLVILNFCSQYLFSAPSFIQKGGNLFLDNIISGISLFAASILTNIFLTKMKRKQTSLILSSSTILFASLMLTSIVSQNSWLKASTYFIFRLIVSVYLNNIFILNFQSFPTQIRASAGTITSISGQASGIVQPYWIKAAERSNIPINYQYILMGIIAFIVTFWMKQTFEQPPPEIIQEIKHQQSQQIKKIIHHSPHKQTHK